MFVANTNLRHGEFFVYYHTPGVDM